MDDHADAPVTPAMPSVPNRTRPIARAVIVVSLVAAIVSLTAVAVTSWEARRVKPPAPPVNPYAQPEFVTEAIAAAQQGTFAALALNGKTFDQDLERAQQWATAEFASTLAGTTNPFYRGLRTWFDLTAHPIVSGLGVVDAYPRQVTLLISAEVTLEWRIGADPNGPKARTKRTDHLRWVLTVVRIEAGWRIAKCSSHTERTEAMRKDWAPIC